MMQRIGIRKTAGSFLLTKPNLEKSAVVSVDEKLLDILLEDEFAQNQQDILEQLYLRAEREQSRLSRIWSTFRTENAFWHIQGIISTAMFAVSSYFLIAISAGAVPVVSTVPTTILSLLIPLGLAVSSYSLWALFTKRRARKRRAALLLFMVYIFQLTYLNIIDDDTALINITFASLACVAVALFSEWSRPSR
jgi:hypothetical protein